MAHLRGTGYRVDAVAFSSFSSAEVESSPAPTSPPSIGSPGLAQVQQLSVVHVTNPTTFDEQLAPMANGLHDPRLGPLEGERCPPRSLRRGTRFLSRARLLAGVDGSQRAPALIPPCSRPGVPPCRPYASPCRPVPLLVPGAHHRASPRMALRAAGTTAARRAARLARHARGTTVRLRPCVAAWVAACGAARRRARGGRAHQAAAARVPWAVLQKGLPAAAVHVLLLCGRHPAAPAARDRPRAAGLQACSSGHPRGARAHWPCSWRCWREGCWSRCTARLRPRPVASPLIQASAGQGIGQHGGAGRCGGRFRRGGGGGDGGGGGRRG